VKGFVGDAPVTYRWGHAKEGILKHLIHHSVHLVHHAKHAGKRVTSSWKHGVADDDTGRRDDMNVIQTSTDGPVICTLRQGFGTFRNLGQPYETTTSLRDHQLCNSGALFVRQVQQLTSLLAIYMQALMSLCHGIGRGWCVCLDGACTCHPVPPPLGYQAKQPAAAVNVSQVNFTPQTPAASFCETCTNLYVAKQLLSVKPAPTCT
jgi:hypothetical protein